MSDLDELSFEPRRKLSRREVYLGMVLVFFGLCLILLHYQAALKTWFYREDSRYFSNGIFSPYDLIQVFFTPQNAMGHYRPITKLFWGLPEWLGVNSAVHYHLILLGYLLLATYFLARLSYLLYGNFLLSIFAGFFWAMAPVNAKPVYWICANQDLSAVLFVLSALTFRIEQWRKPQHRVRYRRLCLLSVFLALSSREIGFAGSLLLPFVDWIHGKWKKSWDFLALWLAFFFLVFLISPPFSRAKVTPAFSSLFSFSAMKGFWTYSLSSFWTLGDAFQLSYPLSLNWITAILLLTVGFGAFRHRTLRLPLLLALAGITPFLLIQAFSVEYANLFCAGLCLSFSGVLSYALRRRNEIPAVQVACLIASMGALSFYYFYLEGSRHVYKNNYMERSLLLKSFMDGLREYSLTLPPYKAIRLVDLGTYKESEARDSHHFIPSGLDTLAPERVFQIAATVLNSGEGTQMRDPKSPLWIHAYPNISEPIFIRYTAKGFQHE